MMISQAHKVFFSRFLIASALLIVGTNLTSADLVYEADNQNLVFFTSGSFSDRSHAADTLQIDTSSNPNKDWRIDSLNTRVRIEGVGNHQNVTAKVRFWAGHNPASATNVFSDLLSEVDFNIGDHNVTGGAVSLNVNFDYLGSGNSFILPKNQPLGLEIDWRDDAGSKDIQTYMTIAVPPNVGSSTPGIYLDVDENNQFSNGEFLFSAQAINLRVGIEATAIPEPAGFGGLVVLLLVLLGVFSAKRNPRGILANTAR